MTRLSPSRRLTLALGAVLLLCAAAADPAERLADPAKEARARALFHEVRCLVCQSQSIDESEAPLAHDLRQLVRQEVAAGESDDQIRSYLVSRYGQFVLLTPKVSAGNAVLWAAPALIVLIGGAVLLFRRRSEGGESASLSEAEEAAVRKLSHEETV